MNLRLLIAIAASFLALPGCGPETPQPVLPVPKPPVDPARAVKALMDLTLPDLNGTPQALAQWRGKVIVANYWATWCAPCKAEMPGFSRLHDKYSANGIQFIGISIDAADKIREFSKETPVNYPLLVAGEEVAQTAADLGNTMRALPFTVIIDRDGSLRATKLGRYSEEALEQELRSLNQR